MAATPFNLEDALQSIHEKGFYDLNEPLAGDRIAAMERNHFRVSEVFSKNLSRDAASVTGSDTKNILATSNALGEVGWKLAGAS
ncbi:uncharacterized protein VDAG_09193 [Verticillium dahliae VdLs.17]|uniref:Uncharacterized protein n=1 Tax=Verticillium dahliae (strain VdLs.17 / ATCC MYA-4575 / FGSC 10137) TaxID=498257 RepID=G2XFR9_VERDV|nr:uncharacterized protein VDAG_09193 [Verticillium dahliae VdLs.17]EGY18667.1 hypothetical protein VDAG_09193 [Verticillium dahliae VdLs.17]